MRKKVQTVSLLSACLAADNNDDEIVGLGNVISNQHYLHVLTIRM